MRSSKELGAAEVLGPGRARASRASRAARAGLRWSKRRVAKITWPAFCDR